MSHQKELVYCHKHDEGFVRESGSTNSKCSDGCKGKTSELHGFYLLEFGNRDMIYPPIYYERLNGGFEDWCWDRLIEKYLERNSGKVA